MNEENESKSIKDLEKCLNELCEKICKYEFEVLGFPYTGWPLYECKDLKEFIEDLEHAKKECFDKVYSNIYRKNNDILIDILNSKIESEKKILQKYPEDSLSIKTIEWLENKKLNL